MAALRGEGEGNVYNVSPLSKNTTADFAGPIFHWNLQDEEPLSDHRLASHLTPLLIDVI